MTPNGTLQRAAALISAGVCFLSSPIPVGASDAESLRQEARLAAARGVQWLKTQQAADGSYSLGEHPAITALALSAQLSTRRTPDPALAPEAERAIAYLTSKQREDGGIYESALASYNTAHSVVALVAADRADFDPVIRRARQFLISQQNDLNEPGKVDHPGDGGIGYGNSNPHADVSNTAAALEALRASAKLDTPSAHSLNWDAAIEFLRRSQQLPETNTEGWVSRAAEDRGGFVYHPGESRAGAWTNAAGVVALRSYGSMTYAGLLSLLYVDLKKDDPRVVAAVEWTRRHFTVSENPGMGAAGHFYYLLALTKALDVHGTREIVLESGGIVDWRRAVILELIQRQQADGSWVNTDSARWMERDPVLVTAYSILALSRASGGL